MVLISNLGLPALELVEERLGLGPDVELGVVVDEEDEVGVVDEPLARVVERVLAVNLPGTRLKNAGDLGEGRLRKVKPIGFDMLQFIFILRYVLMRCSLWKGNA